MSAITEQEKIAAQYYCTRCWALEPEDCACDFEDEDNFTCCNDCDLPDACFDFGCAIENKVKRKPDNIF